MKDIELGLDVFEMADDEEIRRIAADCPASPEEKERMFKLSHKIYNERTNESNEAQADVVSGVEQYKKPIWHKIVSAAAALTLVAGLGTGGYLLARNKSADNHFAGGEDSQVQQVTESNYPFGSLENERVRMTRPAIAPAVIELSPEKVSELVSILEKLPWEEIEEPKFADGEYSVLYFYNNGEPYMLDVGNGIIRYFENFENEPRIYSGSEQLAKFISSIDLDPDDFLYDTDNDSAEDVIKEVWTLDKKDITIDERSADDEEKSIPNFTGMQADLVKQQLSDLGLEYQVKKEENNEVHPNYIIRTEPRGGTKLRKGDTVTLYVSLGADPEGVITVDDYVGKAVEDAAIMAGYREFSVLTYDIPSNEPRGTVIDQYPKAGDQALSKTVVYFFLSKGEYTADEITYRFITPEGINGRYSIDIIWTDSDGKTEAQSTDAILTAENPVVFSTLKGEGSGIKGTAVITNLANDKKADIGTYILDFDKGDYTIEEEDIEAAFEAIQ